MKTWMPSVLIISRGRAENRNWHTQQTQNQLFRVFSPFRNSLENLREIKRQDRIETHIGDDDFLVVWIESDAMRFLHSRAWFPVNFPARRDVATIVDAVNSNVRSFRFRKVARCHLRDDDPAAFRLNFDLADGVHAGPRSANHADGLNFAAGRPIKNQ